MCKAYAPPDSESPNSTATKMGNTIQLEKIQLRN